jgi:hypothetical protein
MRASFGGLRVITLIFVVSTSLTAVQRTHQTESANYSDCYCRFGYPAPYACEPEIYCGNQGGRCAGTCAASAQSK